MAIEEGALWGAEDADLKLLGGVEDLPRWEQMGRWKYYNVDNF